MFWNDKSRVFRDLKRLLRDLDKAESDIKKKNFEQAFKDLRIGFLDNKKLIRWLKKHHSAKIDSKNLTYGSENLDHLFSKVTTMLMEIRGHYNENDYLTALSLIEEMEKLVLWEIKSDKRYTKQNVNVIQLSQDEILDCIKKADRTLVRIMEKYRLDNPINFITITNKNAEKKKFLSSFNNGIMYNPIFIHKPPPEDLLSKVQKDSEDVMRQLRSLNLDFTKGAAYLLQQKRINLQIILNLIRCIGTTQVTKYSMQLYGFPSNALVSEAYRALKNGKMVVEQQLHLKLDKKRYSSKDFQRKTDQFFRENGMNWKTVIKTPKDMFGRFKIVIARRELWVNDDAAPFSERDIIKAIEHEIRVHVFRSESGRNSPLRILAYGTMGYLPTEEGLTTYFEDLKNARGPNLGKTKYLYVITEFLAAKGSFYHCFSSLIEYGIKPDEAWNVVVRIKRGLTNTAQPGGFFKDHVYFLGDKLLRKFIASGGRPEDLLEGKIGINDVKHLVKNYRL